MRNQLIAHGTKHPSWLNTRALKFPSAGAAQAYLHRVRDCRLLAHLRVPHVHVPRVPDATGAAPGGSPQPGPTAHALYFTHAPLGSQPSSQGSSPPVSFWLRFLHVASCPGCGSRLSPGLAHPHAMWHTAIVACRLLASSVTSRPSYPDPSGPSHTQSTAAVLTSRQPRRRRLGRPHPLPPHWLWASIPACGSLALCLRLPSCSPQLCEVVW